MLDPIPIYRLQGDDLDLYTDDPYTATEILMDALETGEGPLTLTKETMDRAAYEALEEAE